MAERPETLMELPETELDVARRRVLAAAREVRAARSPGVMERPLWQARGLVLARDVRADGDHPAAPRALSDGYAVRAADVAGPARLRVVGELSAGEHWPGALEAGQAVALTTGAPLPDGADAVHLLEGARREGDEVALPGGLTPGDGVVGQGEFARAGEVVVPAGTVVDGLTVGVLASVGAGRVSVFKRPRVVVVATGSELVELDEAPSSAQVRDSNRHTLMAMLEAAWCRVVDGGRVPDDHAALRRAVREGLDSDVLVLSGGMSSGPADRVREVLEDEGVEVLLHNVRIRPGKPVLVGRHAGGLVFGLPGNPVSTFVTGHLLLLPAVRVLEGRRQPGPWVLGARLDGRLDPTGPRTTFHPGRLEVAEDGSFAVVPLHWGGSGDQIAFARGDCLIRREQGAPPAGPGEMVSVLVVSAP